MRGFLCALAITLAAGQANAAPLDINQLAGEWRAAGGTCDSVYLHAVDRGHDAAGLPTLFGAIVLDNALVRGDIPLDGPNKGRLLSEDTGKPVLAVAASGETLKLTVLDKSSGLKSQTLELCPGSRPDFAGADRMALKLPGGWFDINKDGGPVYTMFSVGKERCAPRPDFPDRRGAWAFKPDGKGGMLWSKGSSIGGYSDWKPIDIQPDGAGEKMWLKMTLPDAGTWEVSFWTVSGSDRLRMVAVDYSRPSTREYREACP